VRILTGLRPSRLTVTVIGGAAIGLGVAKDVERRLEKGPAGAGGGV
jgi:glycerol-3-phosphate dehydrogenase